VRLLVLPRNRSPYQELLYAEMQRGGVRISYIGELTPSHTLNVFLLPLETGLRRIGGCRIIHIHWVFFFALPGESSFLFVRRVSQVWFQLWLRVCRILGMNIVWTAHNVLPHYPVFADDVGARRALVRASALLVAHSEAVLDELAALGAVPRRTAIIQHGPIEPTVPVWSLREPGGGDGPRHFLFLGRVEEYKGVEDLLTAFSALPSDVSARLLVAGQCDDRRLRARLRALEGTVGSGDVVIRLEYVPEEEVTELLAASDVVVLPFRRVTTSGSAMLALSHGRPLIVPRLPGLAHLPGDAVLRYEQDGGGLTKALAYLACADRTILERMSTAAFEYSASVTWQEIAEDTISEFRSLLNASRTSVDRRPVRMA
jgi:glycosyltransferase involved in cell wall biosynthesis